MDEMHSSYASKGVGNAGLALGIIGTALGAMDWTNIGGGLFGRGGSRTSDYCQSFEGKVSELQSQVASLEAKQYSDAVALDVYKAGVANYNKLDEKINANLEKVYGFIIDLDKKTALNTQALEYENKLTNVKIDHNKEMNMCADQAIMTYVNATFLPGVLKLPITSVCPEPAQKTTTTTTPSA